MALAAAARHRHQLEKQLHALRDTRVVCGGIGHDAPDAVERHTAMEHAIGEDATRADAVAFALVVPLPDHDGTDGGGVAGAANNPSKEVWFGMRSTGCIVRSRYHEAVPGQPAAKPKRRASTNAAHNASSAMASSSTWDPIATIPAPADGSVPMCATVLTDLDATSPRWPGEALTTAAPTAHEAVVVVGYSSGIVSWYRVAAVVAAHRDVENMTMAKASPDQLLRRFDVRVTHVSAAHGPCTSLVSIHTHYPHNDDDSADRKATAPRPLAGYTLVLAGYETGMIGVAEPGATVVRVGGATQADATRAVKLRAARKGPNALLPSALVSIVTTTCVVPANKEHNAAGVAIAPGDVSIYAASRSGDMARHVLPWSARDMAAWAGKTMESTAVPPMVTTRMYSHADALRYGHPDVEAKDVATAGLAITYDGHGRTCVWLAATVDAPSVDGVSVVSVLDAPSSKDGVMAFPWRSVPSHTLAGRVAVGADHHAVLHTAADAHRDVAPSVAKHTTLGAFRCINETLWLVVRKATAGRASRTNSPARRGRSPTRSGARRSPNSSRDTSPVASPHRMVSPPRQYRSPPRAAPPQPETIEPGAYVETMLVLSPVTMQPVPISRAGMYTIGESPTVALVAPASRVVDRMWVSTTDSELHVFHVPHHTGAAAAAASHSPQVAAPPAEEKADSVPLSAALATAIDGMVQTLAALWAARPVKPDPERQALAGEVHLIADRAVVEQASKMRWLTERNAHGLMHGRFAPWATRAETRILRRKLREREQRVFGFQERCIHRPQAQHRFNTWLAVYKKNKDRRERLMRISQQRIDSSDAQIRRRYLTAWVGRITKQRQRRTVEVLAATTTTGLQRVALRRLRAFAAHKKQLRARQRNIDFLARTLNDSSGQIMRSIYFKKWAALQREVAHKRERLAVLETLCIGVGGNSDARMRSAWRKWALLQTLAKKRRAASRLSAVMATTTTSSRRVATYRTWMAFVERRKAEKRDRAMTAVHMLGDTRAKHSRIRFAAWVAFRNERHQARRRAQLDQLVMTMMASTEHGARAYWFHRWRRNAHDKRDPPNKAAAQALARTTTVGILRAYYAKWGRFVTVVAVRRSRLTAASLLLGGSDHGQRIIYYRKWAAYVGEAKKEKTRLRWSRSLGRSTDRLLLAAYFRKLQGWKAMKQRRFKQRRIQRELVSESEVTHLRRSFRSWMACVVSNALTRRSTAQRDLIATATACGVLEAEQASLQQLVDAVERSHLQLEQSHTAAVHDATARIQERSEQEDAGALKEELMALETQLLAQRRDEAAHLRKLLGPQMLFVDVAKQQQAMVHAALDEVDALLVALEQQWNVCHDTVEHRRAVTPRPSSPRRMPTPRAASPHPTPRTAAVLAQPVPATLATHSSVLARLPSGRGTAPPSPRRGPAPQPSPRPSGSSAAASSAVNTTAQSTGTLNSTLNVSSLHAASPSTAASTAPSPASHRSGSAGPVPRLPIGGAVPRCHMSDAGSDAPLFPTPRGATVAEHPDRVTILRQLDNLLGPLCAGREALDDALRTRVSRDDRLAGNVTGVTRRRAPSPALRPTSQRA